MKQMRSRFRLLTLLLVCAFLVTLAVCTGTALKTAGVTLSSLLPASPVQGTAIPAASVSTDVSPGPGASPSEGSDVPGLFRDLFEGTDNTPDPEYNVFGL